jgi:hypothetical protein
VGLLVLALFPIAAWILPGYWLSRWRLPVASPLVRTATSLLFGLVTVVPVGYATVYAFRTPMTPLIVLGSAAIVSVLAVFGARRFPVAPPPVPPNEDGRSAKVVAGVLLLVVAASMFSGLRSDDATSLFSPCLHEGGLVLLEDGTGDGLEAYDDRLGAVVTHLTARPLEFGYGLEHILGHQRVGSMAVVGQAMAFHGSGALVVLLILYDLLVALLAALFFSAWVRSMWGVLILTGVFVVGCHTVSAYVLNENMLALGLALGVWWMARRADSLGDAIMLGAILSLWVALRPIALCMVPAVIVLLPRKGRCWAGLTLGLVLSGLPWLWTNAQNFGSPFAHPSLEVGRYMQSFMGLEVQFHPLNWPVADTLLRGADNPFPGWFRVPLGHLAAFGAVFWTLAALGAVAVRRRILVASVLVAAPVLLILGVIVSLDHEKMSYALMAFAPLPTLVGAGVATCTGRLSINRRARMTALVLALAFVVGLPALARTVPSTVDTRDQYHTTRSLPGVTVETERDRLLATHWLPDLRPHQWNVQTTAHNWALLWQGRPPQRSEDAPVSGPLVLWLDHEEAAIEFQASVVSGTVLAKLLADSDMGCITDFRFVGASIYLENATDDVTVRARVSRGVLAIAIANMGSGDRRGTVSFGLHYDNVFQDVRVTHNGRVLPMQFLVREDPRDADSPTKELRVVSNHAWHYDPDWDRVRVQSGLDTTECGHQERRGRRVGVAPGALLWSEGDRSCRFRMVTSLHGIDPTPSCAAIRFEGETTPSN